MAVEALKSFFDIATVVLLFLTFLAGAGVLLTGNVINKQQAAQLHQFDSDLTHAKTELGKQQERAAKAEAQIASADAASKDAVAKVAIAEARVAEASAKAESFRLDIARAEEAASQAKAQVAQATAEAAKANLELAKIKSPRSVTDPLALTEALKAFGGTEYLIVGCFQDQDSIDLLKQIDQVLTDAGWKRGKIPSQNSFGDIVLNISKDFAVPISSRSGVFVAAQSKEQIEALKMVPMPLLPMYIRAAMALKGGLASGISPSQDGLMSPLVVEAGDSTSVFIIVGKKP